MKLRKPGRRMAEDTKEEGVLRRILRVIETRTITPVLGRNRDEGGGVRTPHSHPAESLRLPSTRQTSIS